ncbi:MAG: hypothetical protein WC462_00740 [archaeon]
MEKLIFAQKFPFSENARDYLKDLNIPIAKIPENASRKAQALVEWAFSSNKSYDYLKSPYNEDKEAYVIAYPLSKMLVSVMRTPNIIDKFADYFRERTFALLQDSDEGRRDLCLALADDFKLSYDFSSDKDFFVEVPLMQYLEIYFVDPESKLINKNVSGGKVFLNLNDFARFLAEKTYLKIFDSLPIDSKQIPKEIHFDAKSIDSQLVVMEKKNFDLKLHGKIDPNLFPPCMKVLYADQLAGKKLHYMARLSLAAFLFQLGMSKTELLSLFSKSPDFKRQVADYHINRIFEKQLSAPGCKKLEEYGLKVAECNKVCTYKHPLQYYLAKLRVSNRMKIKNDKFSKGVE